METTKLIQVSNFMLTSVEDENNSYIVVENIGRGWEVRYSDTTEMYGLLAMAVQEVKAGNENAKMHLEATLCDIFVVSTLGVHDESLTGDICEAAKAYVERVRAVLANIDKEAPAEDSNEWMKRQTVMEDMLEDERNAKA